MKFPKYIESKKEIKKEYARCRIVEKKYEKKLKGMAIPSVTSAQKVCNRICRSLYIRKFPNVILDPSINTLVKGYYKKKGRKIIINKSFLSITVLLHELAHFVCHQENLTENGNKEVHHGDNFLFALETVYEAFFELYCY